MNHEKAIPPNRIFLIGFMGSGKTYLGKQLAEKLGWEFMDSDTFLEANEGMKISDIFEIGGESLFRQLEQNYLHATGDFDKIVVATGGGAPCFFDNMNWLKANGLTIYLKSSVPVLLNRLIPQTAHRPLLAGKTENELRIFIENKLIERSPFYEQADLIFEYITGNEDINNLLDKIIC